MMLLHDPQATHPRKLGSWNAKTFGAYLRCSDLFIKRYKAAGTPSDYPDYGCPDATCNPDRQSNT